MMHGEYTIKRVAAQAAPEDRALAGWLLPSTKLTSFAPDASLTGIVAKELGLEQVVRSEDFHTAALCLFAEFVPPELLEYLTAEPPSVTGFERTRRRDSAATTCRSPRRSCVHPAR